MCHSNQCTLTHLIQLFNKFVTRYVLFIGMTDCTVQYSTVYSTVHWDD